jgi:hypothetical protein
MERCLDRVSSPATRSPGSYCSRRPKRSQSSRRGPSAYGKSGAVKHCGCGFFVPAAHENRERLQGQPEGAHNPRSTDTSCGAHTVASLATRAALQQPSPKAAARGPPSWPTHGQRGLHTQGRERRTCPSALYKQTRHSVTAKFLFISPVPNFARSCLD